MTSSQHTYILRNGVMTLDEDMSLVGRGLYCALIILLGSLAIRIQTHHDATLLIKFVSSAILLPILLWFLYLVSWRKQVTIDFFRNKIDIHFGPAVFLFNNSYQLSNYRNLEVVTMHDHTVNVQGAPRSKTSNKVTKKFYLHGDGKIHIATRCYSASDREREMCIKKLEQDIRQHLENRRINVKTNA